MFLIMVSVPSMGGGMGQERFMAKDIKEQKIRHDSQVLKTYYILNYRQGLSGKQNFDL